MNISLDHLDRAILNVVQCDASLAIEEISEKVGLSRNACWRRIKALEANGTIKGRVAILDASKVGAPLTAFVLVKTSSHDNL